MHAYTYIVAHEIIGLYMASFKYLDSYLSLSTPSFVLLSLLSPKINLCPNYSPFSFLSPTLYCSPMRSFPINV